MVNLSETPTWHLLMILLREDQIRLKKQCEYREFINIYQLLICFLKLLNNALITTRATLSILLDIVLVI